MKIDQVMIKEMLGNISVGHYAAAVKISEAWYFIPIVINSSLFPAIINAKSRSSKEFYTRLKILFSLMLFGAVAISLPTTISVSEPCVNWYTGSIKTFPTIPKASLAVVGPSTGKTK